MTDVTLAPRELRKGANAALRDLGAELGGLTVFLDSRGHDDEPIDATAVWSSDVVTLELDAVPPRSSGRDAPFSVIREPLSRRRLGPRLTYP